MIEIVEFYQLAEKPEKNKIFGSLHIYIEEGSIDLRGIGVYSNSNGWFFKLPAILSVDPETGKKIRFPVFSYLNREKNQQLKEKIKELAIPYIDEKLKDKNR